MNWKGEPVKEKRQLKRRSLVFYLTVTFRDTDEVVGQLVDLTHEGMMLSSTHTIEKDEVFPLSITLPEPILHYKKLSIDAACRWIRPEAQPGHVAMGFEFFNLSDDARLLIARLLMDYRMQD